MTTIVQIKNNAVKAFNNKNYHKAFKTLWELGVEEFLQFSQKEDRKSKKYNWLAKSSRCKKCIHASNYFWNTFILEETVFITCFTSERPVELLHNYYSKTFLFNQDFETKLAKEYPDIFVEAIRKNEVFFKEDRITFLLTDGLLTDDYAIHQDVWEAFQETELNIWKQIETTLTKIENHPLERIFFFTVAYFEENNFNADFDSVNKQLLAENYSFFIDLILRNQNIQQQGLSSEQFFINFSRNVFKNEFPELKKLITKILGLIADRQNINSRFFQPYCYNNQFQPKDIYESLYFYESPESYYQWYTDEIRYNVNEFVYGYKGHDTIDFLLKNGAKIASEKKEDYADNKDLANKLQSTIEALKDLQFTHYTVKDTNNKNIFIEIEKIIPPIYCYAFNKYIRYHKEIDKIKSEYKIENWHKTYAIISVKNKERSTSPFIYNTKQEYYNLNSKADATYTNEISSHILNQFGFKKPNTKLKFNRFNIRFSVIETPFILLGDYIFSPVLFFVNFAGYHVYINSLLNNNNRINATKIEEKLAHLLIAHNFKVKHPTKKEVDLIDGDADLIVYDDNQVLLLQLKRTNLRLDYKAQYNELINTDIKASNQLNKAEKFLNEENAVFEINNRKVTKWIVSNSFEKVNTTINNCLKVNYLDIVSFLTNNEGMTFDTLSNFISFFETDTYFKTIAKQLTTEVPMYNNMLSLSKMETRNLFFKDYNTLKASKYDHFYNKGLEKHKKGNYKEALKTLKKCLALEQKDFRIQSSIANIYVDLKDYKNAILCYEKALELVPNDPFIKRNYAITLKEIGDPKFKEIYEEITDRYPLLDLMK